MSVTLKRAIRHGYLWITLVAHLENLLCFACQSQAGAASSVQHSALVGLPVDCVHHALQGLLFAQSVLCTTRRFGMVPESPALQQWRTRSPLLILGSHDWNTPREGEDLKCGGKLQAALLPAAVPRRCLLSIRLQQYRN